MINKQLFKQVGGIISSGKEANVYQAIIDLATLDFLALKIYSLETDESSCFSFYIGFLQNQKIEQFKNRRWNANVDFYLKCLI